MSEGRTPRHSPFTVAGEDDLLYSLSADGSRKWIDPIVTKGRFYRIRLIMAWVLIAIFLLTPNLSIGGKPLILLDLAHRQFTLLGATFHPTDNLMLLAAGASFLIGIFALAALFGRLWCGYGCPHLVYLEFVYRPIERLLEGKRSARKKRNQGPWNADKLLRKGSKWLLYLLICALLSFTFVSYFISSGKLFTFLTTDPLAHKGALFTFLAVTALQMVDFAYFRDQMCTVACPWGRLQTVLYDRDTVIVGYNQKRGEPRGVKKKSEPEKELGDCIDCKRCVTTCPTGMDIRRGLQMECVGCAQCIEACDEVMTKTGKEPGLIRYATLRELEQGKRRFWRTRVFVYFGLLLITTSALTFLSVSRRDAEVEVLRSGREPFRMLPTGEVANLLRVRFTNHLHQEQSFTIELKEPKAAELIVSRSPFVVQSDRVATCDVVAKLPADVFQRGRVTGRFVIQSKTGGTFEQAFVLLGPYR